MRQVLLCFFTCFLTLTAQADPAREPRYGTTHDEPKRGQVVAAKYPGNLYGVSAFSRLEQASREEHLELSKKVMLRAAQLALENDRSHFSMFAPAQTETALETRTVRGTQGYTTWVGRMTTSGQMADLQQIEVAGTPARVYHLPQYDGQWTMVKLWTEDEAAARGPQPKDSMTDYVAEEIYLDLVDSTPGRWPDLADIYSDLASRALKENGGKPADEDVATAVRSYLKLAGVYARRGEEKKTLEAVDWARALLR